MKNSLRHLILVVTIIWGLGSCSKLEEVVILNENYLFVADVMEYCQGGCDETPDWEGSEVLVKGYVKNVDDDSAMSDYYENGQFYLSDIRNGMFMEIRVTDEKDAIFEMLYSLNKKDMVFIRGNAESVIVNEGNECMKGVVIELNRSGNVTQNQ